MSYRYPIMLYKFPHLSRQEGERRIQQAVPQLLKLGLSVEQVAQALGLHVEAVISGSMKALWIDAHISPAYATSITSTFGITAVALPKSHQTLNISDHCGMLPIISLNLQQNL